MKTVTLLVLGAGMLLIASVIVLKSELPLGLTVIFTLLLSACLSLKSRLCPVAPLTFRLSTFSWFLTLNVIHFTNVGDC
jgi:hypothetical protein